MSTADKNDPPPTIEASRTFFHISSFISTVKLIKLIPEIFYSRYYDNILMRKNILYDSFLMCKNKFYFDWKTELLIFK